MLCVVVLAGGKGVEPAGQTVDRRLQIQIVVVRKNYMKIPVELGRGELVEVLGDEGNADEVRLRALADVS